MRREVEIPPCEGRVFEVERGDIVRIVAIEGPQAADLIAFNTSDFRESLSTWLTRHMSGSFLRAKEFYTNFPAAQIMFTAITDRPGLLWLSPGRCNPLSYRTRGTGGPHLSCQDILAGCVESMGLGPFDMPDVLNIFMNATLHADGTYEFGPSPVEPGDSFDMTAEMDATVAVSACPDEFGAYNEFQTRPLGIQVVGA
ncbi:MAG: DUF1989 domain-containing protein [Acidimicrobiales bacterium]